MTREEKTSTLNTAEKKLKSKTSPRAGADNEVSQLYSAVSTKDTMGKLGDAVSTKDTMGKLGDDYDTHTES